MKKPHPRANNELEIIDRIDRLTALMWDRRKRAENLDAKSDKWFKEGKNLPKARDYRERAEKLRKMEPATMKRLEKLKQKLSEMRTMIMPGIVPDESVQL